MLLRRRWIAAISAAAALLPAVLWLRPALLEHRAPTLRDQGDFFYPLKLYTAERLRSGEIPLWNPLSGTGEPWLANGQSGVFYPPSALFLLPSAALAGALFLLFHFAVAVWGARRFLKEEAVSDSGALAGSAAFAASGFAGSLSPYWNHFGAFCYMPAIAAVARGGLRTRGSVLALGALVGLQAMAGSPEVSGMTLLLAVALAAFPRDPFPEPAAPPKRWAALWRFAAGAGLGIALAAWVLVPMAELFLCSDRRHPFAAAERDYGAVGWHDLLSVAGFSPPWFGGGYLAWLFLPPFALVAAGAAFRENPRRRLAAILGAFGLLGGLLAARSPASALLRAIPPLDRIRYPGKALAWTSISVAMLCGLGLDALRFAPLGRLARLVCASLSAVSLAFAAVAPLSPEVRALSAAGAAALAGLALVGPRSPLLATLCAGSAALALAAALGLALVPVFRFAPEAELRRCPPEISPLSSLPGRVVTPPIDALIEWVLRDGSFDADTLRRQRLALIGYANLPCAVSSLRTAAPLRTAGAQRIADAVGPADDALAAGAASARALWTPFRPLRLPSRKIGEFFRAPIAPYRPRLSFVRGYRVEPDAARAWELVSRGRVDLTREVVLDRRPSPDLSPAPDRPLLVARLAEDRPERVVAELTSTFPGLLVLTDLRYPGWIAEEGSERLPMLTADGLFRAVALPAGTHRVVFRYRPISFYAGAAVSAAALLTIVGLGLLGEPVKIGRKP